MAQASAHYVPCGCKAHLNEKDPGAGPGELRDRFLKGDWEALSMEEQVRLAEAMKK